MLLLWLACAAPPADPTPVDPMLVDTATADATEPLPACVTEDFVVRLGTGADGLTLLEDGDAVELVHGPQGGWHVEVAAALEGAGPAVLVQPRIVVAETGELLSGDDAPTYVRPADWDPDTCAATFWHEPAFVDDHVPTDQAFICSLDGVALDYSVQITDLATDAVATDLVRVVAALDPDDAPRCESGTAE